MDAKENFLLDEAKWKKLKKEFYGKDYLVGIIDFSLKGMEDVVARNKLTYDEYLETQYASQGEIREWFFVCYYEAADFEFKGVISSIKGNNICFKKLAVSGFYFDGTGFDGKEDHVWMDYSAFKGFKEGDCVSFGAEVYRYIKTKNGKVLDYGLRNPYDIRKIEPYEQPTDDELREQFIDQIICGICLYREQCYSVFCLAEEWRDSMKEEMLKRMK